MTHENWNDIRADLDRLLDDEAWVFTDDELNRLEKIVTMTDKHAAAVLAGVFLRNSPLEGELLQIFSERISKLLGQPLDVHPRHNLPIYERSAWVTNPETKTFERGW